MALEGFPPYSLIRLASMPPGTKIKMAAPKIIATPHEAFLFLLKAQARRNEIAPSVPLRIHSMIMILIIFENSITNYEEPPDSG